MTYAIHWAWKNATIRELKNKIVLSHLYLPSNFSIENISNIAGWGIGVIESSLIYSYNLNDLDFTL